MSEQTNQPEFLLLLQGKEWYTSLSQAELEKVMGQFKAWFDGLAAQGKIKGGQALARSGAIVSGKNGRTVADGPFTESKEAIGGFIVLRVDTLEEAIAIAKSNPSLAYGSTIEVRPIAEECPFQAYVRKVSEKELATA
jgi:hypothetical protein